MQITVKFLILILVWLSIPKPTDLPQDWDSSYIFGQSTSVQVYRSNLQNSNIQTIKLKPFYPIVKSPLVNHELGNFTLSHKNLHLLASSLSNFISSGAMIFHQISSSN